MLRIPLQLPHTVSFFFMTLAWTGKSQHVSHSPPSLTLISVSSQPTRTGSSFLSLSLPI